MSQSNKKDAVLDDIKVYNTFAEISERGPDNNGFYTSQELFEVSESTDGYYRSTSQGYEVQFCWEHKVFLSGLTLSQY